MIEPSDILESRGNYFMEETLGKRIAGHRKGLGLTQDRLAELLGITAQAVSKWENDQSCPDITMLPKLAEVFGISIDELLGLEKKEIHTAELITQAETEDREEPNGIHVQNGKWEFQWDGGRKSSVGFALWLLLFGGLLLLANLQGRHVVWELLWTTGLLVFGLFGLYPKFSFFRLGCALFGGYFLLNSCFHLFPFIMGKELLLPIILLLFGLSLLVDALRKPKNGSFHVKHNGKSITNATSDSCVYDGECFFCATCFGGNHHLIQMSRLSGGKAEVSFGELTLDLSGCEEIVSGCAIGLDCSFGELEIQVPKGCRVEPVSSSTFASVEVKGSPEPSAPVTIYMECDVSFGQIIIRYL